MDDWIDITSEPLSVDAAVRSVTHPDVGGIDVFLGTTRSETSSEQKKLASLDYEAYADMAMGQMRDLAARARQRWPILRLAVLHRIGRVAVGEPSVIIAVACPHRAEAFEACRWLIDALKAEVAIWKREVWADGSSSWVRGHAVEGPTPPTVP
jgi:molybdopterin synthase catalytic subunit